MIFAASRFLTNYPLLTLVSSSKQLLLQSSLLNAGRIYGIELGSAVFEVFCDQKLKQSERMFSHSHPKSHDLAEELALNKNAVSFLHNESRQDLLYDFSEDPKDSMQDASSDCFWRLGYVHP